MQTTDVPFPFSSREARSRLVLPPLKVEGRATRSSSALVIGGEKRNIPACAHQTICAVGSTGKTRAKTKVKLLSGRFRAATAHPSLGG